MCEDVINTHIPYSLLRPNEIHFSSLYIISTVMLNFCIKSVHSFLALTTKDNNSGTLVLDQQQLHSPLRGCPNIPSPVSGLSFITFSDNTHNPTNVVDSAAIKPPPPLPPAAATTIGKKDPGGIGFLDEVGVSVSGLMSCTESLGFESSDERRVDDQVMERIISEERGLRAGAQRKWRRRREEEVRKFPPPLSSLNRDGRRCFFLRPVRRDGRLELTGVKIDRMEVLHASRQDGRLRLDMVRYVVDLEEDIEEEETVGNGIESIDNNNIIEEEEKLEVGNIDDIEEEMDEEKIGDNIIEEEVKEGKIIEQEVEEGEVGDNIIEEEEEEGKIIEEEVEEGRIGDNIIEEEVEEGKIEDILKEEGEEGASGKWVFGAMVSGGGDGFRRCHEVASHHHHHHHLHHYLHAWGQHCLTIR